MNKKVIVCSLIVVFVLLFIAVAILLFGVKIGNFEIKPMVHITFGNNIASENKQEKKENSNTTTEDKNSINSSNNQITSAPSNTDNTRSISTNNNNNNNNTNNNTNKKKSYKYVFTTNGAAILKQTTSDSASTWYSAICSNCGTKSKMYVNSSASFTFMSDQVTDTYKKSVICENCKKLYKIEITCQRIEK